MATVQYRQDNWSIQSGAGDLMAAYTIATGVGGWVGGFEGFKEWRGACSRWLGISTITSEVAKLKLELPALEVAVLTSDGIKIFEDGSRDAAFGGDPVSQWLGANLCALAYNCGSHAAVDLLVESMVPNLFPTIQKNPSLKDSLHKVLLDHVSNIVNEGAARKFATLFMDATSHIPNGDNEYMKKKLNGAGVDDRKVQRETSFVAGFLWWLTSSKDLDPYLTRSGLVMRVAACLKATGCFEDLASGVVWNGQGKVPNALRAPILVTGGVDGVLGDLVTDKCLFPPGVIAPDSEPVHYRLSAVGAAFVNSFHHLGDVRAEECQNHWFKVRKSIRKQFACSWKVSSIQESNDVEAHFERAHHNTCDNQFAISLAAIYFPAASEALGHCYSDIATDQKTLDGIQQSLDAIGGYDDLPHHLQLFRVLSACILLAFAELLAGSEFDKLRHVATLDLDYQDCLQVLTKTLNDGIADKLPFWQAATLVSAVHAGIDTEAVEALRQKHKPDHRTATLGRRSGMFCVLPRLLADMQPSEAAVGLKCFDKFIANVPVDDRGWIIDGSPPKPSFDLLGYPIGNTGSERSDIPVSTDLERQAPQGTQGWQRAMPFLGAPLNAKPDTSLFLGIERPKHYSNRHLILSGRISGSIIAQVSVRNVMRVLGRSLQVAAIPCPGHDPGDSCMVLNTSTSCWVEQDFMIHREANIFLHTDGDKAWTLFAAGQMAHLGGMIVFNCVRCVQLHIEKSMRGIPSAMMDFRGPA